MEQFAYPPGPLGGNGGWIDLNVGWDVVPGSVVTTDANSDSVIDLVAFTTNWQSPFRLEFTLDSPSGGTNPTILIRLGQLAIMDLQYSIGGGDFNVDLLGPVDSGNALAVPWANSTALQFSLTYDGVSWTLRQGATVLVTTGVTDWNTIPDSTLRLQVLGNSSGVIASNLQLFSI